MKNIDFRHNQKQEIKTLIHSKIFEQAMSLMADTIEGTDKEVEKKVIKIYFFRN